MTELDIQVRATIDEEIHALLIGTSPFTPVELELSGLYANDEPEVNPLTGVITKVSTSRHETKDSIVIEGNCDEPIDGYRYFRFAVWYHVDDDEIGGPVNVDAFDYNEDTGRSDRSTFPLGGLESIGVGETLTRNEVFADDD